MEPSFDWFLAAWLGGSAIVAMVMSGIAGMRVHLWLARQGPALGRRLPTDSGVWIGMVVGLALFALSANEYLHVLACSWPDLIECPAPDMSRLNDPAP